MTALVRQIRFLVKLASRYPFSFLFLSLSLAKEEVFYIKEAKLQEEKVERLKAEAGDEYVIKKQVRRNYLKQHLPC